MHTAVQHRRSYFSLAPTETVCTAQQREKRAARHVPRDFLGLYCRQLYQRALVLEVWRKAAAVPRFFLPKKKKRIALHSTLE